MTPLLMLPGPTPLPPSVQAALQHPLINHRSAQWEGLFQEIENGLKWAYQTPDDILMFSGSGTTAMEAALVNTLSPGDLVLAVVNGSFGHRFANMAEAFGANVIRLEKEWGDLISPSEIETLFLKYGSQIKAFLMVHSETSTGVLNPLKEIIPILKKHECLSIIDAVSSLSTVPLPVKEWGLDLVITASQKSFMSPPGLSFVSISPKAWHAYKTAECPRYTLDFKVTHDYAKKHFNPWTPPMTVYFGLKEALKLMQTEGLTNIQARHEHLRSHLRQHAIQLGLIPWVKNETDASRSVTPLLPPKDLQADAIRLHLLNQYQVSLGGAQRKLEGQFFRVGHLGYQSIESINAFLKRLELTLNDLRGQTL